MLLQSWSTNPDSKTSQPASKCLRAALFRSLLLHRTTSICLTPSFDFNDSAPKRLRSTRETLYSALSRNPTTSFSDVVKEDLSITSGSYLQPTISNHTGKVHDDTIDRRSPSDQRQAWQMSGHPPVYATPQRYVATPGPDGYEANEPTTPTVRIGRPAQSGGTRKLGSETGLSGKTSDLVFFSAHPPSSRESRAIIREHFNNTDISDWTGSLHACNTSLLTKLFTAIKTLYPATTQNI